MKIGICTGGGDCPGLNPTIRAIVKHGIQHYNMEFFGIKDCFNGMMDKPYAAAPVTLDRVTDILNRGGTILGTHNKGNPYVGEGSEDRLKRTIAGYHDLGLDALIVIGGEGTQGITQLLISKGINAVGIPKTIDNDLPETEYTLGFSTCVDLVADSVMRLQSTAESHDRVMVLEVMGRDSGYIALHGGIAGGAHVILIPEIPFSIPAIVKKINARKKLGRNYSVIVVSEGASEEGKNALYQKAAQGKEVLGGIGQYVAQKLAEHTDMETRFTVLGHLQRGGAPNAYDRLFATQMGVHAVELLQQKRFNRVVVVKNGKLTDIPYTQINSWERRQIARDDKTLFAAEAIGISLGTDCSVCA